MTTTIDERALLRAINKAPKEDTPRLAYADYLDEQGDGGECRECSGTGAKYHRVQAGRDAHGERLWTPFEFQCHPCSSRGRLPNPRAEFIRVQCELARLRCDCTCEYEHGIDCPMSKEKALRARERALFTFDNIQRWFRDPGPVFDRHTTDPAEFERLSRETAPAMGISVALVTRGFVSAVTCDVRTFVGERCVMCQGKPKACLGNACLTGIAGPLFAAAPVERVTLSDREPRESTRNGQPVFWWVRGTDTQDLSDRAVIPHCLWTGSYLGEYGQFPTRDLALSALDGASVRLGRKRAGLIE